MLQAPPPVPPAAGSQPPSHEPGKCSSRSPSVVPPSPLATAAQAAQAQKQGPPETLLADWSSRAPTPTRARRDLSPALASPEPPGSERLQMHGEQLLRMDPELLRSRECDLAAKEADLVSRTEEAKEALDRQQKETREALEALQARETEAREAREARQKEEREARAAAAAREEALQQQQAELAVREKELVGRERRLADREADVHTDMRGREQQLLERERRLAEREAELTERWRDLSDRQEQWRMQQFSEREALEARSTALDQMEAAMREEEARHSGRRKEEEEKLRESRRQLEEQDLRWSEAIRESQVLKQCLPKARFSPRNSKDHAELARQMEEQQTRMQAIKRNPGSWGQTPVNSTGSPSSGCSGCPSTTVMEGEPNVAA